MKIISRKGNESGSIKKYIFDKFRSFKLDINEEIGMKKINEFREVSRFRKIIKIAKVIIFIIGIVSGVMTIISFLSKSDESIALDNYQKGIIYLEDDDYKQAEQCLEKAYKVNNNLLDIKFYYAYAEYWLKNYDKSYQILKENRNTLNQNELAFYAMYEYSKGNYKKSSECLNKISQPENMEVLSFSHYIITSTELGFLSNYSEGISTFYANMILLEAKINETKQLPSIDKIFHVQPSDTEHREIEGANEVANRINENVRDDVLMLKRCKLISYTQFIAHSIQYDEYALPVYIFEDAAESIDFLTNQYASTRYIEILLCYSIGAVFNTTPEELEKAFKIVVEKYKELKLLENEKGKTILKENDREKLEACEAMLKDLENNCLDSNKDKYKFNFSGIGVTDENYNYGDVVKAWANAFLSELYINDLVKN